MWPAVALCLCAARGLKVLFNHWQVKARPSPSNPAAAAAALFKVSAPIFLFLFYPVWFCFEVRRDETRRGYWWRLRVDKEEKKRLSVLFLIFVALSPSPFHFIPSHFISFLVSSVRRNWIWRGMCTRLFLANNFGIIPKRRRRKWEFFPLFCCLFLLPLARSKRPHSLSVCFGFYRVRVSKTKI